MLKHGLYAAGALLIALAPAVSAFADGLQDGESRAVLANPAPKAVDAFIDGRTWHCQDTSCVAFPNDSALEQTPAHECHRAAIWLGKFTAFQTSKKTFSDMDLAACNANVTTKEPRSPS